MPIAIPTGMMDCDAAMTEPQESEGTPSDAELMLRAGRGDMEAFEAVVRRHQHAVIGTAAKMLGDPIAAEDIAQTVFLRAWKSAPRYRPTAKFTTWLMTITRNLVFNETRRRSRARLGSLADTRQDHPENEPDRDIPDPAQQQPDDAVRQAELAQAIEEALATLPEKARLAVILRRYENLPYEEIAEVLELTLPAVKSLLFRARTELREKLAAWLD